MADLFSVWIGWDSHETQSYEVALSSLRRRRRLNGPVVITHPLKLSVLRETRYYWRENDIRGSTEFTISRFLIPALESFKGWALYVDCDVLFLEDVAKIFELANDKYAVMVVKHDYKPGDMIKKTGEVQEWYPRKNWSSVVLWNCGHSDNRVLTKELVNEAAPSFLHRFEWLNDDVIGALPATWNHLVGWKEGPEVERPNLLHFTEGVPAISEYRYCHWSSKWKSELVAMYSEDMANDP